MKLHQDGTLSGTPEEIAAYMKLKDPMFGKVYIPLDSVLPKTVGAYKEKLSGLIGESIGSYTVQEKWANGVRYTRVNDGPWKETPPENEAKM